MRQLQVYEYTIPALGAVPIPAQNDNFIVLASTGPVTVRGDTFGTLPALVAGQGLKSVPFSRLELVDVSGAPNTVKILLAPVEFVNQVFSGSVGVVGNVGLNVATINALNRPEVPNGSWVNTATIVANTPLTVFAPGANLNGAIVWEMAAADANAGGMQVFIGKNAPPANIADGDVIAMSYARAFNAGGAYPAIDVQHPRYVTAGQGLYFIASSAGTAGFIRHARYTLL